MPEYLSNDIYEMNNATIVSGKISVYKVYFGKYILTKIISVGNQVCTAKIYYDDVWISFSPLQGKVHRIMDELHWIIIFGHEWGDLPINFTSEEVTSENRCQITSQVTKNSLFTVKNVLFYLLHASTLCPEHTITLITIVDCSFHHCREGGSFLT